MTFEQELFTNLLIKCISNSIYKDDLDMLRKRMENKTVVVDDWGRAIGSDWPSKAHSMAGIARLTNVRDLAQQAIDDQIPGDFIETGVWRGGCCILLRGILKINNILDRKIYVADSFEGLPKSNVEQFPRDSYQDFSGFDELAVSLEEVRNNFAAYDLLDDQVEFVKGFFSNTLSTIKAEHFALLRLDGDLYESTIVALENLYPKLSPGGFVIIDDYNSIPPCREAVDDYREKRSIVAPLNVIDGSGVWWQNPPSSP